MEDSVRVILVEGGKVRGRENAYPVRGRERIEVVGRGEGGGRPFGFLDEPDGEGDFGEEGVITFNVVGVKGSNSTSWEERAKVRRRGVVSISNIGIPVARESRVVDSRSRL